MTDLKLKTYAKPDFVFEQDSRETRLPGAQVAAIDMELDFGRVMKQGAAPADEEEAVDIESLAEPGLTTIVHLHPVGEGFEPVGLMASTRSGNYLAGLEKKYRGRVVVKKVDITSWDCPTAKKYNITALPQFWFYDSTGALSEKLTERFTTDDIDAALKKARR